MTPEFMLDTDAVSSALRGQGDVSAHLLEHRPSEICLSSITLAELRFGADSKGSRRLHRLIDTFVSSVQTLPFDQAAADRFGVVALALRRAVIDPLAAEQWNNGHPSTSASPVHSFDREVNRCCPTAALAC